MTDNGDLASYAESTYARPGVAEHLLRLQDRYGLDVLLLLCAAWVTRLGRGLPDPAWVELVTAHSPVREQVLAPLRQARRAAREAPRLARAYQRLKEIEVEIELCQLRMLGHRCLTLAEEPGEKLPAALLRCGRAQGVDPVTGLQESLDRLAQAIDGDRTAS